MMTVKEWREAKDYTELKEFAKKMQVWLGEYTNHVYRWVMDTQLVNIINSEFALKLIDELYERTLKEQENEIMTISFDLEHDSETERTLHLHPVEHSNSYRDVLYDMYIKNKPRD